MTEPGVGTNRYAYAGNSPVNQGDPSGHSWLDSAWDGVFGGGSFNATFGDNGSAWSDKTFGNGGEVVTGNLYSQEAASGTSYSSYKSQNIEQNQEIFDFGQADQVSAGDGVVLDATLLAVPAGWAFKAGRWVYRSARAGAAAEAVGLSTASSLQAARLDMQLAAEQAAGARAPRAITSYSKHVEEQILGRDGVGVSRAALEDAFANPRAIRHQTSKYGPTFQYVGKNATIAVNTDGRVISGWATNRLGFQK